MTTHTHTYTSFTGLEVETGKQAEGENLSTLQAIQSLSRGYSQSDTRQQPWKLKEEKKNLKYVEMMILRDVMESRLPKSTLISNGFFCSLFKSKHFYSWADWNKGLVIMKQRGGSW